MRTCIYTVNQPLFSHKKISRGLREPRCHEYFLPRTSPCHMVIKTTRVWIRLNRKHKSLQTNLSEVNCEIKSSQIKVGLKFLFIRSY